VDFFDDDAAGRAPASGGPPAAPPKRRRPDPRRTRIQRLAILAVILFVVVFGMAWWARSCQHDRKVGSYRSYFDGVGAAVSDSATLGKKFNAIVNNPTKLSRDELIDKLEELTVKQDEIAVRSARLEPPDTLVDEQDTFATGMRIRANGFRLLQAAMVGALTTGKVGAAKIAALNGYFAGPDAYYMDRVYLPARTVMSDEGVSDVVVPTSTYFLNWKAMDPARLEAMLASVGSSSKLSGIHGVGLVGVTAKSGGSEVNLVKGQTIDVPATADLTFVAKVQNQGTVVETDVPVTATLTLPGGATLKQEATIATIKSDQTQDVIIPPFTIPNEALGKTCTLKVTAGPVPNESVETNNSGQFKFVLQLQ
jgi:hypothetical protein